MFKCWLTHAVPQCNSRATLAAASGVLGLLSIAADLGIHLAGEVWADASAALGIIKRKGLGKTRRVDIGLLGWCSIGSIKFRPYISVVC